MIKSLEFLFSVMVIGVSFSLIVMFLWFVCALIVNFWKIYIRNPSIIKSNKKIECQEMCSHKNSRYTESHPDLVWTCNDCGKVH